jgi:ATPase subunit of ABC transporter with duplicated ATPase domains
VLANAIKEFKGTILLSSHDRMFIDKTVSKLWILERGLITEFPGNLGEFIER